MYTCKYQDHRSSDRDDYVHSNATSNQVQSKPTRATPTKPHKAQLCFLLVAPSMPAPCSHATGLLYVDGGTPLPPFCARSIQLNHQ